MFKKKVIMCDCGVSSHQIVFTYDPNENKEQSFPFGEMWVEFYLFPFSFFKRLFIGIKYIFGYRSDFGDFGEIILDKNSVKELDEFFSVYLDWFVGSFAEE